MVANMLTSAWRRLSLWSVPSPAARMMAAGQSALRNCACDSRLTGPSTPVALEGRFLRFVQSRGRGSIDLEFCACSTGDTWRCTAPAEMVLERGLAMGSLISVSGVEVAPFYLRLDRVEFLD